MNKNIIPSALLLAICFTANVSAQEVKVDKKVEIVKSYSPVIGNGIKLEIDPFIEKEVVLEAPKFDYSIAFKPQRYTPSIATLESFDIANFENKKRYNLYADISLGYPLNSKLNAIYSTNPKKNLYVGAVLRHEGFFGKLTNDYKEKLSGMSTTNHIGGFLQYRKNRLLVDINVGYSFNYYKAYGKFSPVENVIFEDKFKSQNFNIASFDASVGTDFGRNKKWDAKFYTSAIYLSDSYIHSERDILLGGIVSKGLKDGRHRISVAFEYMSIAQGKNGLTFYENQAKVEGPYDGINIKPLYRYDFSKFTAEAGVNMHFSLNNMRGIDEANTHKTLFLPRLLFQFNSKRFTPYISMNSDYKYNGYVRLSSMNPYVIPGATAPNSFDLNFVAGLKGSASTWLNYRIEAGYQHADNVVMFYNILDGNMFDVITNDFQNFILNAEFNVLLMDKLSINGQYNYVSHSSSMVGSDNTPFGLPDHTFNLSILYKITNKWSARLSSELKSSRTFIGNYRTTAIQTEPLMINTIPTKFNLGIGASYVISKTFTANLDLYNLLNEKLYEYNHYRGIGFSAMIGISAKF